MGQKQGGLSCSTVRASLGQLLREVMLAMKVRLAMTVALLNVECLMLGFGKLELPALHEQPY